MYANLSCHYMIMRSEETYKLDIILKGDDVFLVNASSNESVVLTANEMVKCRLTAFNENGETEQWTKPWNIC